jgi:hypothetical protein
MIGHKSFSFLNVFKHAAKNDALINKKCLLMKPGLEDRIYQFTTHANLIKQ